MKIHTILYAFLLCIGLLLTGCDSEPQGNTAAVPQEKLTLKEYTIDEIYCDPRYADDYLSPVLQRMQIYPAESMTYLYAGSPVSDADPVWHTIYKKEDGTLSVLHDPFCYDPLCTHSNITCLAYATKGTGELIPFEDKVYFAALGNPGTSNFIEYSLSTGKHTVINTHESGRIITRMGRFIYFMETLVTGQDKTGKQEELKALHRYDLETGKTDYLGERSGDTYFGSPTPYNGEIYYTYANAVYKCDYNLRYPQKISGDYKIKMFEIRDGVLWFLTETGDVMSKLYRKNLDGGDSELLYENVTWFCIDGDTLYYSLYDPIDAFEWEIWMKTKDGQSKKLVTKMVQQYFRNTIYRISPDKAGKKGTAAPFCETLTDKDFYLADVYAIHNGMLIGQFKEPYSEGTRKGMTTGKAVIDVETGDIIRITSISYFPENTVFPYEETD